MDSSPQSTLGNVSINVPLITNNTVEVSTTPFLLETNSPTRILSQAQFTSEDVEATQRVEQISRSSLHAKDPMDPEAITTAMLLKQMVSMHLENTKWYEHDRLQKDRENRSKEQELELLHKQLELNAQQAESDLRTMMSENEKNREKASHLTKELEDERLKAMEKQRLQDQEREDAWRKQLAEQEVQRRKLEEEREQRLTQERVIDLKRRTVEEAVRNFSKLDKIDLLEAGLSNFEALLSIHDANEDDWMKYLRIVLRVKPAEMMEGLHLPVDTPYFDVKEELLHKCRIIAKSAGENLFQPNLEQ